MKIRSLTVLVALASLIAQAGCSPIQFSLFGSQSGPLEPKTVIEEDGARDRVALIDLRGLISPPIDTGSPIFGGGFNITDDLIRRLDLAREDSRVKAVVLRIDSPGGSVTTSDMIYQEIRRFREETGKPVVASLGSVAASGGYYAALAADEIVAEPTSVTGSIGVIIPLIDASEGLNSIGIYSTSLTSGDNKDLGSPVAGQTAEGRAVLMAVVDDFFARFKGLVAERRPGIGDLDAVTDGSVFSGERAAGLGLVDSTGSLRDAFGRAKSLAGLESAQLVKYARRSQRVSSPYALTDGNTPTPSAALVDLGPIIGHERITAGRAYYLWIP